MAEPRTLNPGAGNSTAPNTENHISYGSYNTTNNNKQLQAGMQLQGPNSQARNILPTVSTIGLITGGARHTIEEILQPETTPGSGDGHYTCWTDGALTVGPITNVNWIANSNVAGWNYYLIDCVYGGGGSSPNVSMYWTLVSLYVATK
jgi:hypothetical protein